MEAFNTKLHDVLYSMVYHIYNFKQIEPQSKQINGAQRQSAVDTSVA